MILRVQVVPTELSTDTDLALIAAAAVTTTIDLGANPIDVQVGAGWITLRGSVPWNCQRRKVIAAIGALRGVRGITNLISISTADVPAIKIKSSIEAAFQRLFNAGRQRVGVCVVHGDVTLTGTVTSGWQRAMLTRSAWNAAGVRSVRNELVCEVGG